MPGDYETYEEASLRKFWEDNKDELLLEYLNEVDATPVKEWTAFDQYRFDVWMNNRWRETASPENDANCAADEQMEREQDR